MPAVEESAPHAPHVVGNAFVEQYYNLLYKAPQEVYNFYQEASVLSRPGQDGVMVSVTTKKDINDQILSFDYQSTKVEILTADSQESYKNGVIVLVTAFLIEKNNLKRKFTQSFFLVPQQESQDKCYFVLNDVLRYVDETESVMPAVDDVNERALVSPLTTDNDLGDVSDKLEPDNMSKCLVADADNDKESLHPVNNGEIGLSEFAIDGQVDSDLVSEVACSKTLEDNTEKSDAPVEVASSSTNVGDVTRKSYAAILAEKSLMSHPRVSVAKRVEQPHATKTSVEKPREITKIPEKTAFVGNNSSHKNNVKGSSIFVANLPMNATDLQLHETFSKFGIIESDGVQVRSQKQKGNCFGFVAFKAASSVQSVLEAYRTSPIIIGGRKVSIEEKQGSNDGRKVASNRGGYRNENGYRRDNFRDRGNSNGGRNYGSSRDQEKQGGEARGEANEKVYQNGRRN